MVRYAEEKGLIFRPETAKYGSDGWFRLTIGTEEENRMAVETIREFFAA
jgi:histidinol-phosphate/aromatic aminotransferase/cobyric acid decarboxylase-like protein